MKVFTGLLAILAFNAFGGSIYTESMQALNKVSNTSPTVQTLSQYQGQTMLTSFFMPNCRWCQRQHKALKSLQHICPQLQTVMLGVQGNKQNLKRELRREKNTFPAYIASNNIIKAIGENPVPMMLIFNKQGKLAFKTVGYTPAEKLTQLFEKHQLNICTIKT